ncbi:MAG: DUF4893 domain-containing protein [Pseudomonadota bacterium]
MTAKPFVVLLVCMFLAGCGGGGERPRPASVGRTPMDWRGVATPADRERLRNWRTAWTDALAKVRAGGRGGALAPMGALFEPDRALAGALPPVGDYRCRTFKLGAKSVGLSDYSVYPWFACRVEAEGEVLSFFKETGSQRPVGLVFRDGDARGIFLGTLLLGDETSPMQYGQDRARDMAGIVERIGERRWRLVLPYPEFESTLDVVEFVPAR